MRHIEAWEELGDGAMCRVLAPLPAGRPADDLELMVVATTDDVSARVGQPPNDCEVSGGRGSRA